MKKLFVFVILLFCLAMTACNSQETVDLTAQIEALEEENAALIAEISTLEESASEIEDNIARGRTTVVALEDAIFPQKAHT